MIYSCNYVVAINTRLVQKEQHREEEQKKQSAICYSFFKKTKEVEAFFITCLLLTTVITMNWNRLFEMAIVLNTDSSY